MASKDKLQPGSKISPSQYQSVTSLVARGDAYTSGLIDCKDGDVTSSAKALNDSIRACLEVWGQPKSDVSYRICCNFRNSFRPHLELVVLSNNLDHFYNATLLISTDH